MAKPFDATLKHLVEGYPEDWLRLLRMPVAGPVEIVSTDLSTITTEADSGIRIGGRRPYLLHTELQSSYEVNLGQRVHRYNTLLDYRHDLPVRSVVFLLRPEADGPAITGKYVRSLHTRRYLTFRYNVVRVWELEPEQFLQGLGTLPLVPLAGVHAGTLPELVQEMGTRLQRQVSSEEAASLWTATYVLMGLRYAPEFVGRLLAGVRDMKESLTYQAIVEEGRAEGRAEGLRQGLLVLGTRRFGLPNEAIRNAINAQTDPERLERWTERLLDVESWDDLGIGS